MKTTNTTTTTTATTTTNASKTISAIISAIPAFDFFFYGFIPAPAISPMIARVEKEAIARGFTDDSVEWHEVNALYKSFAIETMARVYMRHTHSDFAAYVSKCAETYAIGDIDSFVTACAGISCTSANRDRLGRAESRLIVSESRARKWARAQTETGAVDLATARAVFPDMDEGKIREHAVARALHCFDHVPDSGDFFNTSDIIDSAGRAISVKSGSGATIATVSGLWGACIARADTVGALELLRAGLLPIRHTTGRKLHFPRLDNSTMYDFFTDIARICAAFNFGFRADFLRYTEIRVNAGATTVHIVFD